MFVAHAPAGIAGSSVRRVVGIHRHEVRAVVHIFVAALAVQHLVVKVQPEVHLPSNQRTHPPETGRRRLGCQRRGLATLVIEAGDIEVNRLLVVPVVEQLAAADVIGVALLAIGVVFRRRFHRADEVSVKACGALWPQSQLEVARCIHLDLRGIQCAEAGAEARQEFCKFPVSPAIGPDAVSKIRYWGAQDPPRCASPHASAHSPRRYLLPGSACARRSANRSR